MRWMAVLALVLGTAACGGTGSDSPEDDGQALQDAALRTDVRANGRRGGTMEEQREAPGPATSGTNGIAYHGGPVMRGTTHVYFVWYGNWNGDSAKSLLPALARGIGGTPYFRINTTYKDGLGRAVKNAVSYGGSTSDHYSHGAKLSDRDVKGIVNRALANGALPTDANGVYFVLASPDVSQGGFCSSYCGWHTHGTLQAYDVKYAFVGNPARCPDACEPQTTSPNGNAGADAMASTIAHELDEAVTDPDLDAWYDKQGYENADKCAWTYGKTWTEANGSSANVHFGGHDWLIQRNWVNAAGGYCAMSY